MCCLIPLRTFLVDVCLVKESRPNAETTFDYAINTNATIKRLWNVCIGAAVVGAVFVAGALAAALLLTGVLAVTLTMTAVVLAAASLAVMGLAWSGTSSVTVFK